MKPNDIALEDYQKSTMAWGAGKGLSVSHPTFSRELEEAYFKFFGQAGLLTQCREGGLEHSFQVPVTYLQKLVSKASNLHLRTIAAAIQTSLISLRNIWGGKDPSTGLISSDSNILTIQSRKSSAEEWYPLKNLNFLLPLRLCPESSWEVSLELYDRNTTFIFVLSLIMTPIDGSDVIIHLIRKTRGLQVVDFCLVGRESYSKIQERVEEMIFKEMKHP